MNAVTFTPSEVRSENVVPEFNDLWTRNPLSLGLEFVSAHDKLMLEEDVAVAVSPVTVTSWVFVKTVAVAGVESEVDEVALAFIEYR